MSPLLAFALPFAALALLACALWPRAPRLSALTWVAATPLFGWAFRDSPGLGPAFFGMFVVFLPMRALAARSEVGLGVGGYLRRVLDVMEPLPSRKVAPPRRRVIARRALRGLLLGGVAAGMVTLGLPLQLWRTSPYLEDLGTMAFVAVSFTGATDALTSLQWALGRRLPDPHDAAFVGSTSLREFWRRWNGMVSEVLAGAFFTPIAAAWRGRLGLALGVLAAFCASGLVHALPLLLATADPRVNARLVWATMAFFLLHGLGCVVEGAFPRAWRRGWQGRAWVWLVFAGTAWLYPGSVAPLIIADRPFESTTLAQAFP